MEADFRRILQVLGSDLSRYALDDGFLTGLPRNSHIALQIEDDAALPASLRRTIRQYNEWVLALARRNRDLGQRLAVAIRRLSRPLMDEVREEALSSSPVPTPSALPSHADADT
jgi:hypothetical protein